jgi:hypothetical protein
MIRSRRARVSSSVASGRTLPPEEADHGGHGERGEGDDRERGEVAVPGQDREPGDREPGSDVLDVLL